MNNNNISGFYDSVERTHAREQQAEVKLATWKQRFWSAIIDYIIITIIIQGLVQLLLKSQGGAELLATFLPFDTDPIIVVNILVPFFSFFYQPIMEGSTLNATVGKMLNKVKVVKVDGSKIRYWDVLKRSGIEYIVGVLINAVATTFVFGLIYNMFGSFIPYSLVFALINPVLIIQGALQSFTLRNNKKGQAYHDVLAKTKVISIK